MKRINKAIAKLSVKFYSEAWNHRNEMLHSPEKHREYVTEWHENVVKKIEIDNKPEMIKYLRMQRLDVRNCSNGCIRNWNMIAMKMNMKARQAVLHDIRNYFSIRRE